MSDPVFHSPNRGDDMDNLAREFSPALDMVLRLHAPLQVRHATDEGVIVCVCVWEPGGGGGSGGRIEGVLNFLKNSWKSPALHPALSS